MSKTGLWWILSTAFAFRLTAQHAHVYAGATDAAGGSRLAFLNASRFAAESGYVVHLPFQTNGPRAGYFINSAPTFTALPSTPINGGPDTGHALPGTHIVARVVSVEGPDGGGFGFWESPGEEEDAEALTFQVPVGERHGQLDVPLSESSGEPGADPYGHVHGRFYSATKAGLYTVGLRLRDTAHNGPGGGPLHPESEITRFHFQAGLTLAGLTVESGEMQVTFATQTGLNYQLESTESPTPDATWSPFGDRIPGNDHLVRVPVPASTGNRFFRLRAE